VCRHAAPQRATAACLVVTAPLYAVCPHLLLFARLHQFMMCLFRTVRCCLQACGASTSSMQTATAPVCRIAIPVRHMTLPACLLLSVCPCTSITPLDLLLPGCCLAVAIISLCCVPLPAGLRRLNILNADRLTAAGMAQLTSLTALTHLLIRQQAERQGDFVPPAQGRRLRQAKLVAALSSKVRKATVCLLLRCIAGTR
jgi:hypothetical protein